MILDAYEHAEARRRAMGGSCSATKMLDEASRQDGAGDIGQGPGGGDDAHVSFTPPSSQDPGQGCCRAGESGRRSRIGSQNDQADDACDPAH